MTLDPTSRPRGARMALLGAAAFGLAACQEDGVEAVAFPDEAACVEANADDPDARAACGEALAAAEAEHRRSAPRYDEQALCEEEHGGACVAEDREGGGGVFLPIMAGYMMGRMLSGGSAQTLAQPLYRGRDGALATATGGARFAGPGGAQTVRGTAFQAPPATAGAEPMSRANLRATGGFGRSPSVGGARGGSFGG